MFFVGAAVVAADGLYDDGGLFGDGDGLSTDGLAVENVVVTAGLVDCATVVVYVDETELGELLANVGGAGCFVPVDTVTSVYCVRDVVVLVVVVDEVDDGVEWTANCAVGLYDDWNAAVDGLEYRSVLPLGDDGEPIFVPLVVCGGRPATSLSRLFR